MLIYCFFYILLCHEYEAVYYSLFKFKVSLICVQVLVLVGGP